jgi:DNA-binding Lrp family transcriptional regulator
VILKPQDVYVALKIVSSGPNRPPYAQLASELNMSASEVHAAVQRAEAAHLLHGPKLKNRPNYMAIEEFLLHGLKYVFPAEHGVVTRGMPTSYAAEPLRSKVAQGSDLVPVWPSETGTVRGVAFAPLYRTAAASAKRDPVFYEYLALADALRDGRIRERKAAEGELHRRFQQANAKHKS